MNGLPKITINVNTTGLAQSPQTEDGIVGMILTGSTVTGAGNVTTGQAYSIFSLQDAVNIGITESGSNSFAYNQIKLFYDVMGASAELWIMLVTSTVDYADYTDHTADYAPVLLNAASGRIRTLAVSKKSATGVTVADGLDQDVNAVVQNAQLLAEAYDNLFQPVKVIVDGKDFNGTPTDLKDYTLENYNRVSIFLGNDDGSKNAAIGLVLGKIAVNPVMRSIGRVRDGALPILSGYFTSGDTVESHQSAWDVIANRGYIFLRSYQARAGYFFSDDPTLTLATDDLNTIKRVAVMDKVKLLAYNVFVGKILDEIPTDTQGKIPPALIKSWEADVETVIGSQMVATGELSAIDASIDPNQDVITSNEVVVTLKALPVGYAKYITVNLGFSTSINN